MATEMEYDVSSTRRKLALIVEDIREIRDQGKRALSDSNQVWLFMGMMNTVQGLYENFDTLYNELCDVVSPTGELVVTAADHILRATAKRYFHESNGFMANINDNKSRQSTSTSGCNFACSTISAPQFKAKLPTLELPKFQGERTQWPRFKDTFNSLVKDDPQLRDIDRFHYLIRSLEGSALSIIAQIPVSDANFSVAWSTLEDAYDNKRLLATAYLDQLLDIKKLTTKPNAATLLKYLSDMSDNIAAFKLLDIPNRLEFIYFYLTSRCLDTFTREQFELQNSEPFPTFDQLIKYLRSRCTAAELASGLSPLSLVKDVREEKVFRRPWYPKTSLPTGRTVLVASGASYSPDSGSSLSPNSASGFYGKYQKCFVCKGPHTLFNCVKFSSITVAERHRLLRPWKGCRNCLQLGHDYSNCPSKYGCKFCKGRHHSLLHGYKSEWKSPRRDQSTASITNAASTYDHGHQKNEASGSKPAALNAVGCGELAVMLGTAICYIADQQGNKHKIRLVLDTGSHFSFITRSFAEYLGLNVENHSAGVWGIGEMPLTGLKGRTNCSLTPLQANHPSLSTSALVVDTITSSLPGFISDETFWQPYLNFELADPEFWVSRPINFLIGCDLFSEILTGQLITLFPDMPKLLGTVFGFSVLGRVRDLCETSGSGALHTTPDLSLESLHGQLSRFWDLEEPPAIVAKDPEDERCEEIFCKTHYRLPTGRYVVRLPFKDSQTQIFGTRNMAFRRLEHLESKLQRNPTLRLKYNQFMQEYLDLGHMKPALEPGKVFIPHHSVCKGEGKHLKLRVVFDAAAKTSSGSLNDQLMVGPKLQTNMTEICLNFRQHQFVFTTDLVKMFRQVLVNEKDRPYLHILWRFNPEDKVEDFELQTVTYGTVPAPYLAIRAIKQLVEDEGAAFPLAAAAIQNDMYVDDLVTGASTVTGALELQHQVVSLLAKGEFTLGKWAANHPKLLEVSEQTKSSSNEPISLSASDDTTIKILGLQWDPGSDDFTYKINLPDCCCTKRGLLSAVTMIYDPLGYIGPSIVLAKIIIQETWKLQLSWDQELPSPLKDRWTSFVSNLPLFGSLHIPRWIVPMQGPFQILVFADASEKAYCAAAYLRSVTEAGPQMHLLFAKTKLAPVKTVTIPRLELCASLLAGRVWQMLKSFCQRLPSKPSVFFFSDSMVVLSWLQIPTHRLKTFVANRVEKIKELTCLGQWHHVASCDNPSDLGSRGVLPSQLIGNTLWFNGPEWALLDPPEWPVIDSPIEVVVPELKDNLAVALTVSSNSPTETFSILDWFTRFSSFSKLTRALCYVCRFTNRCRKKPSFTGDLSLEELDESRKTAVKLVQRHFYFNNQIPSNNSPIPKALLNLSPFYNDAGVLLVGGRLKHSDLSWNTKHPSILPGKAYLSRLIVESYHKTLCHCGPSLLLATLRTAYWITGARHLVRQITRQCAICRRFDAPPVQPRMGNLPAIRFGQGRAFLNVGVDFAGPFYIRESLRRKAQTKKVYLCLFVCLSTKALHLELVSSLSTEAFCAAFDRFIGRRGVPQQMLSDNGTNFVGAANELKELYRWYSLPSIQNSFMLYSTQKEIKWGFNPPYAAFFGGVWEAGVKSVKRLLRTVYGDNKLTFEEMATWLIKIEAILNSRPLCPLSSDPLDLDFLTPGHFLIGCPLLSVPEKSLVNTKENRLSRWKLVSQKSEHFWNRWRTEYLTGLQERTKWRQPSYNLQVGDLVLLKEDSAPRLRWPVGRVVEVFPGSDGIVRVVSVRCHHSILKRPTNRLIPLFNHESD